jgi:hypothetical protein
LTEAGLGWRSSCAPIDCGAIGQAFGFPKMDRNSNRDFKRERAFGFVVCRRKTNAYFELRARIDQIVGQGEQQGSLAVARHPVAGKRAPAW